MVSYNLMIINIVLVLISIILSSAAIYYYFLGNKKFTRGKFTQHAKWMFYGIIVYTIHLFAHLAYESVEIGWISDKFEVIASLSLYIFLAIAGIFFLVASYYYLKLADVYGFKKVNFK